jgi:hypothetical protein
MDNDSLPDNGLAAPEPTEPEVVPPPHRETPLRPFDWSGLTLFIIGLVVGVLGLAIFNAWSSGTTLFARASSTPGLDAATVRSAARQGTLDAIATVQSTAPQAAAAEPTAAPVAPTAFALREANRLGNKDAVVTIVEYSDFQ